MGGRAALRATGAFADVAVIGVPNAEWGEAVVACYPFGEGECARDETEINQRLAVILAAYKRPRRYVAVSLAEWPRNAQGKVNRAALRERAGGGLDL